MCPNVSAWPDLSLTECIRLEVEHHTRLTGGDTCHRFHGTIRACCLGDTSLDGTLCRERVCNMCRIIQVPPEYLSGLVTPVYQCSFQMVCAGERTNFGRFGEGIYTSATSSKVSPFCVSRRGRDDDASRPTISMTGVHLRIKRCFSTMSLWGDDQAHMNDTSLSKVRCTDSANCYLVLRSELRQPPAGYDAVIGELGGDLNECIGTHKTASHLVT